MSAEAIVYLDSSALVKLVVREAESEALVGYLAEHPSRASSALARVEVIRAVRAHGQAAMVRARQLLERISLLHLDEALLDQAAALDGAVLRSLDAIHLAAARVLGDDLGELVTYDRRMAEAAERIGIPVSAPA
ncbi:MAG: type II toxin-antitoxin system VapC family toxin [Solirubrobacterales bacterium]|nr:type II toxin-antitoxin system VapC family toxin [Solirubrobacterales bacterium]